MNQKISENPDIALLLPSALLLALPFLTSCGSSLPPDAFGGYRGPGSGTAVTGKLQGVWATSCTGSHPSQRFSLIFSGAQFSYVLSQYDDATCTQVKYQLTIGKSYMATTTDTSATVITLQTTAQLGQMFVAQGYASSANAAPLCGVTGWQDATSMDVSGKTCLSVPVPVNGTVASETFTLGNNNTTLTYNGQTYTKD